MKKSDNLYSDSLKKGVVLPNGFDNSFCLETLLPAIQQAYVKGFEIKYGLNPDKWSALGKWEFADLQESNLPHHLTLVETIEMQQNLFFWERDQQAALPMGFLLEASNYQLIVFRGTLSAFEWYHDVLIKQTNTEFYAGKIHQGFHTLAKSVFQKSWMEKVDSSKPIFITGHSLGGALATLCAAQYKQLNPTVYLFGSPRVGDKQFMTSFNADLDKVFRVENAFDVVTELPPAEIPILKEQYYHVGKRVYVHAGIEQIQAYKDLRNKEVFLGHLPSIYIQALKLL